MVRSRSARVHRSRIRLRSDRSRAIEPPIELVGVGIHALRALARNPLHRQPALMLPSLGGARIAAEMSPDRLPAQESNAVHPKGAHASAGFDSIERTVVSQVVVICRGVSAVDRQPPR